MAKPGPIPVSATDPLTVTAFTKDDAGRWVYRLNGDHVIQDVQGDRGEDGYIGLQNHTGTVTFRSVMIEPLPVWDKPVGA